MCAAVTCVRALVVATAAVGVPARSPPPLLAPCSELGNTSAAGVNERASEL